MLARGRLLLTEGDAVGARGCFTDAVRIWNDVGAPHEAARARVVLAAALRLAGNEHEAELEARAAGAVLERQPEPIEPHGPQPNIFVREGDYWTVGFDGDTVRVRDLKGVRYLALLLAHPGREFHVLDLVATVSGAGSVSRPLLGDAGEMLDARAKDAYRRRLTEIEEDLEEARSAGDAERAAQAEAERDFLVRELAGAVGLGGRDRRAASASERARAAVTRAIRTSLVRIAGHHPALGAHLNHAIRTGTYCAYDPDPRTPVVWTTLGVPERPIDHLVASRVVHRGWPANPGGSPSRSTDQPTRKPLGSLGRDRPPRSGRSAQCSARAVGVIAWDFASPGPRLWDLAYLAYRIVPLSAADWGDGLTEAIRRERLHRLVAAYGIDAHPGEVIAVLRQRLLDVASFGGRIAQRLHMPELSDHARLYRHNAGPTDDLCRLPLIGMSGRS